MKTLTMTQLRTEPGERIRDVSHGGESFLITKDGKPVAKLVPIGDTHPPLDSEGQPLLDTRALRRGASY